MTHLNHVIPWREFDRTRNVERLAAAITEAAERRAVAIDREWSLDEAAHTKNIVRAYVVTNLAHINSERYAAATESIHSLDFPDELELRPMRDPSERARTLFLYIARFAGNCRHRRHNRMQSLVEEALHEQFLLNFAEDTAEDTAYTAEDTAYTAERPRQT